MSRLVLTLIWLVIGAILAIGLVYLWGQRTERAIVIEPLAMDSTIVVDVRGAVASPGVVRLPAAARVADALAASGGLSDDADVSRLNLAARLADGQRLVIPSLATAAAMPPTPPPTRATASPETAPISGTSTAVATRLVNINTATAAELEALPGIGQVLAGRIVAYRDANGPFRGVDQLTEVEGISPKLVERLRPLVTVGG